MELFPAIPLAEWRERLTPEQVRRSVAAHPAG